LISKGWRPDVADAAEREVAALQSLLAAIQQDFLSIA
jgi:hypothetical protein